MKYLFYCEYLRVIERISISRKARLNFLLKFYLFNNFFVIVSLANFQIGWLALCLSDKRNTKHRFVFFFIQKCDFFASTEMPKMNKK